MGFNLITDGTALAGAMNVGGTSTLLGMSSGTVTIDPPNAAVGLEKVSVAVAITGIEVGDMIMMEPDSALEDDLAKSEIVITGPDSVTVYLYAGAPVNGASRTWRYLWFDLT